MALVPTAESARDVAIGLDKFLEHLPENSTEITALISECYAISSALRELNTAKEDPRYARGYGDVYPDVQIVRRSLEYTLHDLHRLFGGLGRSAISNRAAFSSVWRDIEDHFQNEATTRQRSFERRRPPGLFTTAPDPPPGRPQGRRLGPQSPLSPTLDQDFPWTPPAPEVPNSPTTTTTYSTVSSMASSSLDHWLPRLFEQSRPVTHFKDPGMVYARVHLLLSEDAGHPLERIEDHELHGEKGVYAGVIIDDDFEHALRLFKDRDSGAIRLQASVLSGELKR
ncbi:MAG: hypothetical protein Q9167_006149 [Letrouitia subvulpina]